MALTEKYVSSLAAGGGTGNSEGSAYTFAEMVNDINAGGKGGYRYNIKADGTYTLGGYELSSGGSIGSPVILRGYKTTIGDGYLGRTNQGNLISTNMPYINGGGYLYISANYFEFESLNINTTRGSWCIAYSSFSKAINSIFSNSGTQNVGQVATCPGHSVIINCDICQNASSTQILLILSGETACVYNCHLFPSSDCSYVLNISAYNAVVGNVFHPCSGYAIKGAYNSGFILNNTFYGYTNGCWIGPNSADTNIMTFAGNVCVDSGRILYNPYNATGNHHVNLVNNYSNNITSPNLGYGDCPNLLPVTGTGGASADFINAATGDLRLNDFSLAAGSGINGEDIGAIQRDKKKGMLIFSV